MAEWLATRPESIQRLAAEFPLGTIFDLPDGTFLYLLGYNEDDTLIVSPVSPNIDYQGACAQQEYLCAQHVRAPLNDEGQGDGTRVESP